MSNPWKYFKPEEVEGLDNELVAKLDEIRHRCGFPLIITSGKRTPEQNSISGGKSDSSHLHGTGVDLRSESAHTHFKIVEGAILAGVKRIGVYHDSFGEPSHIHLDIDGALPQEVLWIGVSK